MLDVREVLDELVQRAVLVVLPGCLQPLGEARPNVLFEAGLALAYCPTRTILVEVGSLRPFSDIGGRQVLRMGNEAAKRNALAARLRQAGCEVRTDRDDWLTTGDFSPPPETS